MDTISKNVLDILQLYEFSMAIGNSNNYQENCDSFLKLLLARKNYNACWIYSDINGVCNTSYTLPNQTKNNKNSFDKEYLKTLFKFNEAQSKKVDKQLIEIAPITIDKGCVAVFNLGAQGLLFVHNEHKDAFSNKELNQYQPLIDKFAKSLETSLLYEKREQLLKALKRQNQELNDYAHVVSHDLKSPLISVNSLVNWFSEDYDSVLDDKAKESIQLILNNLERMDDVINGVLTLSSIDKVEEHQCKVDLDILVKTILKTIFIPNHVKIKVNKKLPSILGDHYKFQQLFQNLITNAIKFIDKEQGTVEIGFLETENTFNFFVKDNGIGIDKKYVNKIFEIFQTLNNNSTSTGIGLSIVKRVIDFYEGSIWLESEVGVGTTFYFKLKKI